MQNKKINKLLIANRGEIALRIVRACAEMGIRSVAIYTEPDRYGLFVKRANEAYPLGEDPLAGYLDPLRIVNLAVETGCDAIHPGYGFLSENPELARYCRQKGIIFIGPDAEVIHRMGDKTQARTAMKEAGVPVTPGSDGNLDNLEQALEEAERIGYPVMVKATSGGGGRGIRRCDNAAELTKQYPRVISEATKAFGSAEVFMEKCIVDPMHIEVQILADSQGNAIHLYERDCSIQRRNQKLIEIAPSPQISPAQRQRLGDLAVRAAKAVNYENAGTVEFLISGEEVYFMEMNTRIQVEHTISCANNYALRRATPFPISRKTSASAAMRCNCASMPKTRRMISYQASGASRTITHLAVQVSESTRQFIQDMKFLPTTIPCASSSWCGL